MAIRLVTGKPGAGKTFFLVSELVRSYYSRADDGSLVLKPGVSLFSNIEGYKPEHIDFDDAVKKAGGLEKFFSEAFLRRVVEKYPSPVIVIDEVQRYFDQYYRKREVLYCFEYHRHLGIDFWLSTQSRELLCRSIRDVCEVEVRAIPRSGSLLGEMRYRFLVGGECIENKVLRKDKEIFSLYTSMVGAERVKIKKVWVRWMGVVLLLCVVGVVGFYFTFGRSYRKEIKDRRGATDVVSSRGSVVGADPGVLGGSKRLEGKVWVSRDFACVGDDVMIVDAVSEELVPLSEVKGRFKVSMRGGLVVGVREERDRREVASELESRRRKSVNEGVRPEGESTQAPVEVKSKRATGWGTMNPIGKGG